MVRIYIWTEGPADRKWLVDVLQSWYGYEQNEIRGSSFELTKDTKPEIVILSGKGVSSFITTTGWEKIKDNFESNEKQGIKNLLVIDADESFERRKQEVFDTCGAYVNAETLYLWPENRAMEGQGDLESLLRQLTPPANVAFFECWNGLMDCLRSKNNPYQPDGSFITPDRKSELYAYVSAITGNPKLANETNRSYIDTGLWNISPEHPSLVPLKAFFDKHLTAN